eukprot:TRINITY_DN3960_c0_g1_i1.p1 TRINITY_DN3960_c0_g1~~TRINITY_DN3960_c0_g1_i1.p1  ORF type:complete len:209 (+),score=63.17 TRINITY_DN3960_c0_g1_i1:112-738(+)
MSYQQLDDMSSRLFRVRRTVMQMLHDREYLVTERELEMSKDDFRDLFGEDQKRDRLTIMKSKRHDPDDVIYVFFPEEPKVGVKTIKTYAESMRSSNVKRAILVVQQSLSPFAKQCLAQMAPVYNLEVFQEAELLVNVKEHELVPKHQVLAENEKQTLLDRYNVKDHQLPRMQRSDPVARYYGLTRGQVVRIVRNSETAGHYINYRFVV